MRKKYAFGSNMGNLGTGLFDMSSSLLSGLTMKSVIDLLGTVTGTPESEQRLVKSNTQPVMKFGGNVPATPIEVEGGEVLEMPNKTVTKVKGKKHEQGGIDLDVPPTTKVFSDRLKVGDKSLADRKLNRENKATKLEKYLSKNPNDKITKSTLDRTLEANQQEEERDLKLQDFANQMDETVNTFMYGSSKSGVLKYPNGTPPYGVPPIPELLEDGTTIYKDFQGNIINDQYTTSGATPKERNFIQPIGLDRIATTGIGTSTKLSPNENMIGAENGFAIMDNGDFDYSGSDVYDAGIVQGITDNLSNATGSTEGDMPFQKKNFLSGLFSGDDKSIDSTGMGLTLGDAIGMGGSLQAKYLPLINTLVQRAGDKPNLNMFRDFGTDAISSIEQAKQLATINKTNQLQDLQLGEAAATKRNRNSATSVNTQRALDLATDANVNEATQQAYSAYAQQMMGLLGQQSGLENVQDQYVMQGEQNRDLADRQDRDNYFTQLAQNLANYSNFTQKTGKDLNDMKYREDFLAMLPEISQYGIGVEYENGKPVLKQMRTTSKEEVTSKVEKVSNEITGGEPNNLPEVFGINFDQFGTFLDTFSKTKKKK